MAQLYADEDFPEPVVEELRKLGHDVLTVAQAGQAGQHVSDAQVLAFAVARGRAVVTHNRWDYIKLHSLVPSHAGIIVCTRDQEVAGLAARIHQSLLNCPNLVNQLIRVYRPRKP